MRKDYTLGEWLETWLEYYVEPSALASSTKACYNRAVRAVPASLGSIWVIDIAPLDCLCWIQSVARTHPRAAQLDRVMLSRALLVARKLHLTDCVCSADDIDAGDFPNAISDEIFSKIVAVIRMAVPYTGMIISTRESQESRKKVLELGISQISGGSRTSVGGYAETELPDHNSAQFDVSDTRTLDEVVNWLLELGYIPSFCTACYREGRTGDRFMSLVKSGQIANCCGPNALMTLKEYLEDYASEDTRQKGLELILKETDRIPNPKIREIAIRNLKAIAAGQRDFRF